MRAVPRVALKPPEVERGLGHHATPQLQRRLARLGAGPPAPHVHVHQHVQHEPGLGHRLAELPHVVRVVHHHQGLRLAAQDADQTADLLGPHDLGGDQEVPDPGGGHHLRLAHLGHAHADRAGRDLPAGDLGALVGLGVGAKLLAGGRDVGRHLLDVALEAIEVEQKRRGRDLGAFHGGASIPCAREARPGVGAS